MLNKEKYANDLEEILVIGGVAAFDEKRNEVCTCQNISCSICKFYARIGEGCAEKRKDWLNSEYVDPEVDWLKVPVDTPVLVKDYEYAPWKRRYFSCIDDGKVCTWVNGATSWSADNKDEFCEWIYAKLADDVEIN